METPDSWKIMNDPVHGIRVICGWSGGYLDGDSWRLSSALQTYQDSENAYIFSTASGNQYKLLKGNERVSMAFTNIYKASKEVGWVDLSIEEVLKQVKEDV